MAFGFIKKIFSFGKKAVVEVPQEEEAQVPAQELPAPGHVLEPALLPEPVADAPPVADSESFEPSPSEVSETAEDQTAEPEPLSTEAVADAAELPRVSALETAVEAAFAPEIPAEPAPELEQLPPAELDAPDSETARVIEAAPSPEPAGGSESVETNVETDLPEEPAEPEPEALADVEAADLSREELIEQEFIADEASSSLVPDIAEAEAIVEAGTAAAIIEEPDADDGLLDDMLAELTAGEPVTEKAVVEEALPESITAEQAFPEPEPEPEPVAAAGKVLIGATEENTFVPVQAPEEKLSWFGRLKKGLSRSSKELSSSITGIFTKRKLDEETLQELEEVLIRADLGMETALRITDALSSGRYGKQIGDDEVRAIMSAEIEKTLTPVAKPLELDLSHKPHVILVVGVNGTGKTTTIGKLSAKLREAKLNVWLAAGDTFRAAAIEQLHIWGERTGSPVVSTKIGADAAGLAYDAYEKAKTGGADVLIIDTAGRLQNRTELMDELAKIVRVLNKLDPDSPHTVLQTLDATTGQNALSQVEIFKNVAGVNGLVMTKLDGTARGGILVAIAARHKLPVYFVGVGETVDDLEPFSAKEFASAIAGTE